MMLKLVILMVMSEWSCSEASRHYVCECDSPPFVAFSVSASGVKQPENTSPITYTQINTNYWDGTEADSGLHPEQMAFMAPIRGIYSFSATGITDDDGVVPLVLSHNDLDVMVTSKVDWDDMDAPLVGGNHIILTLQPADKVILSVYGSGDYFTSSFHATTDVNFQGHLLRAT